MFFEFTQISFKVEIQLCSFLSLDLQSEFRNQVAIFVSIGFLFCWYTKNYCILFNGELNAKIFSGAVFSPLFPKLLRVEES